MVGILTINIHQMTIDNYAKLFKLRILKSPVYKIRMGIRQVYDTTYLIVKNGREEILLIEGDKESLFKLFNKMSKYHYINDVFRKLWTK